MNAKIRIIDVTDAIKIIQKNENHFFDIKSRDVSGKAIQQIVVAFANSDGGEAYIGIMDQKDAQRKSLKDPIDRWLGFENEEKANQLIQTIFAEIKPSPPVQYEFYSVKDHEDRGLVLYLNINKSSEVHFTSSGDVYIRQNAQKLPVHNQMIIDLQHSKGLLSYEEQLIKSMEVAELYSSIELRKFLKSYSPRMTEKDFLYKQRLIRTSSGELLPTVAGVLLYADLPQAVLPKKCAVKVVYYDTVDSSPLRENLKKNYTVEGPLLQQIEETLNLIVDIIKEIPLLTKNKFENLNYPIEAIKEILVNALIHRDYNISDDVLVFIFNNRIEIKNPGRLPGHITVKNILDERFSRNPMIVRMLNKYDNPPNKDIGEGLNTAFVKMQEMNLKSPIFDLADNCVKVILPHETLAAPELVVVEYLKVNDEIGNSKARELTGIRSENKMKNVFYKLRDRNIIEKVPGKRGAASKWRLVK